MENRIVKPIKIAVACKIINIEEVLLISVLPSVMFDELEQMYQYRYKSYFLGSVTVQFDKNPAHNIDCICSRVLINSKFRNNHKKLNHHRNTASCTDENFISLNSDHERLHVNNATVSNTYSSPILGSISMNDPLMPNTEDVESFQSQNTDPNLNEQQQFSFCGLCSCFGSMFRYFKKKLFRRKRYKGLQRENEDNAEPTEPKATTNSNNQITSQASYPSLLSSSTSDDTLNVGPQIVQGTTGTGVGDPVKNGLQHMGFAFNASRSDNILYKRVSLDYDEYKIAQWNESLILPNVIEEASSSEEHVFNHEAFSSPPDSWKNINIISSTNTHPVISVSPVSPPENIRQLLNQSTNECVISSTTEAANVSRKRNKKSKKKKNDNNKKLKIDKPPEILANPKLFKYWRNRYNLFSLFDEGIRLDPESWFSVTPEKISRHTADRCRCDVIIDGFCGAGGNSIQFAFTCERVIAIDIDPEKIKLARNNAEVYGVADRIDFIIGDFFEVAPRLQADVVFLSPPWGGPNYNQRKLFQLHEILPPCGGKRIFEIARGITEHIAYFLPRNINMDDIFNLPSRGEKVETEQNILSNRLLAITAYFGELVNEDLSITVLE